MCEINDNDKAYSVNVATFGAEYLLHGQKDLGMFHRAIEALDVALGDYELLEWHPHSCAKRCAEVLVPPAAIWILFAGIKLSEPRGQDQIDLKQWNAWRDRMEQIAVDTNLDEHVCTMASKAAVAMAEIAEQVA